MTKLDTLDFDALLASPPLFTTTVTLDDGRKVKMHELPVFVVEDVQNIGQQENASLNTVMENIVRVVAHSLLGRIPRDEELVQIRERFGIGAVMLLYREALHFSRLSYTALEETKKN